MWKDVYYDSRMKNKIQVGLAMRCFTREIAWEKPAYKSL